MARNAIKSYLRTSKMATGGHFVKFFKINKVPYGSEMARNAIQSDFQTSKMATGKQKFCIDLKWPELKLHIDLKCPEMRSNVNFGHPKWPTPAILSKNFKKNKFPYRSEMVRNAIESEIWRSKMADGSHFVKNFQKKIKLRIDLKWSEMRSKVKFGHPKWPTPAILSKISKKIKICIDLKWPEMWSKVNFGHPKWPTVAILSKI